MNKFDKEVNKRINELILDEYKGTVVNEEIYKGFAAIARAQVRETLRGVKPSKNPKSLYKKTWKNAEKYRDLYSKL
ncbi:MAG: hypothetical protein ACM3X7_07650 [Solirubrobacterales bacterium]